MMRVPAVEAEAVYPCGSDRDTMQKAQPHHRLGRAVLGAPSSSWTFSSRRAFVGTAALVVVTCCALALQIQFVRTVHLAPSASTLRDLRRDVNIHFDPPNPPPDDAASSAARAAAASDQVRNHDAATITATRRSDPGPPQPLPAAASSATDPPQEERPKLRAEASPHHEGGAADPLQPPPDGRDPTRQSSSVSRARELLQTYDVPTQVSPLWNCSVRSKEQEDPDLDGGDGDGDDESAAHNKLVFVHVYKTAGSSMRDFLRWYGLTCRKSVSIVYSCSNVDVATLNDAVWRDRKNRSCKLSSGATSDGREYQGGAFGRDLYQVSDLVGGHLPLGVHRGPVDGTERVQHLTFVRDPLDKYVSGKLYSNRRRNWTVDDAVNRISHDISHLARKGGHYEKYSSYLLTPAQKASNLTDDERVEAMQSNLATMNVLVGVVERMDASYQMIQRVLDASGALDRAFELLRDSRLVRNRSTLSTSDVVRRLHARDPDFHRKARLVLRVEYHVYDFAVKLHEMQYDRLVLRNKETQRALPAR